MVNLILKFISCCRAADMRISTPEVMDCLNQLELMGFNDERSFKTVLRANLVKSRREQAGFDRIYNLFFHEMGPGISPETPVSARPSCGEKDPASDEMAELISRLVEELDPDELDRAILDFADGRPLAFIHELQRMNDRDERVDRPVKSNLGQLSGRLDIMLRVNRLKSKMVQFSGSNDGPGQVVRESVALRLDRAIEFMNSEPAPDNAGLKEAGSPGRHYENMGEIPFSNLNMAETEAVKKVIDRLVKKLEEITSRRFSSAGRGGVDVKKTVQKSVKYLGVPVEIVHRNRPLRKGKVVTLCDVSGSVWSTARFMLNILYSLQSCFSMVKSYVFIDSPVDVTSFFRTSSPGVAVKKVLNHTGINYSARTDYGIVFQRFRDAHFNELDKKTTLIIIGDARSNYLNSREPLLEKMRSRCRRLVWLNPEQERFWGTGDSEMVRYRRHCNEARACGNLNQLIDFVEALVL